MDLSLSAEGGVPLYRQLEAWFRSAIGSGALAPGTRLPSSRGLASDLGVSRTTVDAAYAELLADGLVETRGSGGTVVGGSPAALPGISAISAADRGRSRASNAIDLSAGEGDDSLFPVAALLRNLRASREGEGLLAPSEPAGEPGLRSAIARIAASRGLLLDPSGILVTGGAQQAIALAALALARSGDAVLVEDPGYASATELFRAMGLRVEGLPCDRKGPLPDAFAEAAPGARFAYLMPSFRNPTGGSMDSRRRREVVDAAARSGLVIVEDDYAGGLRYEGRALPPLKALTAPGAVVYTGTFSKLLAPGLGVGFAATEGTTLSTMLAMKRLAGLSVSRLLQRGLERSLGVGAYRSHARKACRLYRERRDALCEAIARRLPGASFERPSGGLFLWVRLPDGTDAEGLPGRCAASGVLVAPGAPCFARPGPEAGLYVRLNFARLPAGLADEAAARLGAALSR